MKDLSSEQRRRLPSPVVNAPSAEQDASRIRQVLRGQDDKPLSPESLPESGRGPLLVAQTDTPSGTDELIKGLKAVWDKLPDKVKDRFTEKLKQKLAHLLDELGSTETGIAIGHAASTGGLALGGLLSDPQGRAFLLDKLGGKNLATLWQFDPVDKYLPIEEFSIDQIAEGRGKEAQLTFQLKLTGKPLFEYLMEQYPALPDMALSVQLKLGVGRESSSVDVLGGGLTFTIWKGLRLGMGIGGGLEPAPDSLVLPGGGKAVTPGLIPAPQQQGLQVMVTLDLLQFDLLPERLRRLLK